MKHILRIVAIVSSCVLGLSFMATRAAAEEETPVHFATIDVPAHISVSEVKDAVFAALLGRDWIVKEKTDGKVVGYLKHRHNEAQVTFTFDDKHIDMSCWGYKITSSGERREHELPKGWLKYLEKDLNKSLGRIYSEKQ